MPSVKLILLEDVDTLGQAGDEVNVAAGYARNFLMPRNLATKASPGALRQLKARKEKLEERRKSEIEAAQALAAKLKKAEVSIAMQVSDDEHLFGSVTARTIADKLAESDLEVDVNKIKLAAPIKELGMFNVDIKLHKDVSASVKVWVVRPEL